MVDDSQPADSQATFGGDGCGSFQPVTPFSAKRPSAYSSCSASS